MKAGSGETFREPTAEDYIALIALTGHCATESRRLDYGRPILRDEDDRENDVVKNLKG